MNLRIHHYFDIIRDLGSEKPILPHPLQHAYHKIAAHIFDFPYTTIEIVSTCDAVCEGCIKKINGKCSDVITHRSDFLHKEAFNNHIDRRIMEVCGIQDGNIFTAIELCLLSEEYLENALFIYEGNDLEHTLKRMDLVKKGVAAYKQKHLSNGNTGSGI